MVTFGGLVFLTVDDSIGDRGGWYPTLEALYHDFGFLPAAKLLENAA